MENNSIPSTAAAVLAFFFIALSCKTPAEKNSTSEQDNKSKVLLTTESPDNERLYRLHCGTCHQWDGGGVPGMYPDLRNSNIVNGNMESLIKLVILGVTEETKNREEKYSGEMPPLDYLSDEDISSILNYIRLQLAVGKPSFTPELVKATRNKTSP